MITQQETFQHVVRGGAQAQSFTIDTESSVIFEILRDKMYKDKIGAVAREVASNSRDANRDASSGKPAVISIIKPNKLQGIGHESVSFKDSGKGMNPEKIKNIYLKYGASDKRTSNVLTGGFGLGAKTPFAYNDTFTVITVADYARPIIEVRTKQVPVLDEKGDTQTDDLGMQITEEVEYDHIVGYEDEKRWKYQYTGMLDSSGKGIMVLFSEKETDEPTGTEVIVPIKNLSDRVEFEKKILKYTKTWGEEVEYVGFSREQDNLEVIYEEDKFSLYKSPNYLDSKLEMIIDGIPYPIDNSIVGLSDTVGRVDSYLLTIMKFETGELSISANRESVQYDDDTVAKIIERHQEFKNFMDEKLKVLVEQEETFLEACIMTYYINRASSNKIAPPIETRALLAHAKGSGVKLKNPTWRGIPTMDKFVFLHHNIIYVTLENGKNRYSSQNSIEFPESINSARIVYGDTRKAASRNATLWEESSSGFYLITPHDKDSKLGIEEFMNFIFKLDLDFQLYSEITPMKAVAGAKGVYVKKSYVTLNIRTVDVYNSYTQSDTLGIERKTFESAGGKDLSKYVFYPLASFKESASSDNRRKMRFMAKRGYSPIYIRKQDYENWFSKTPMVHLDNIYDKEQEAWKDELINQKKELVLNQMLMDIRNEFIESSYAPFVDSILPKILQGRVDNKEYMDSTEVSIVKPKLKFDFEGLKTKLRRIFTERYPLLDVIQHSYRVGESKKIKNIELYIKQVNNYYGI